jgi:hypothetical protein
LIADPLNSEKDSTSPEYKNCTWFGLHFASLAYDLGVSSAVCVILGDTGMGTVSSSKWFVKDMVLQKWHNVNEVWESSLYSTSVQDSTSNRWSLW